MPGPFAIPLVGNNTRVSIFIKSPSKTAVETHWYADTSEQMVNAIAATDDLLKARGQMIALGCSIPEVRFSREGIYKDSLVLTKYKDATIPINQPENLGNDAIMVRSESGSLYRRVSYLAGVPDPVITAARFTPENLGGWDDAFKAYSQILTNKGGGTNSPWGFYALDKSSACPRAPITLMISLANQKIVTVTTKVPHLLGVGDIVRISLVKGADEAHPYNQLWDVRGVVDATSFTISLDEAPTDGLTLGLGGYATKQQKTLQPYKTVQVNGVTTRKRGGRTFLPLGRSKKKSTKGF